MKIFKSYRNKANYGCEIEDSIMTTTEKEKALIEMPTRRQGLNWLWLGICLVMILLGARVFYLDYIKRDYFSGLSQGNRIRNIVIKAPRGNIFDRYGKILAKNVPSIDVVLVPSDLPEEGEERKRIIKELSRTLQMEEGNLSLLLEEQDSSSSKVFLVKENIAQDQSLILGEKLNDLPGIYLEKSAIRSYEDGYIFSHLIGYDGKVTYQELQKNPNYLMTDYIGKTGLEKEYEKELRGVHGAQQVEVDSKGEFKKNLGIIAAQPGNDLILNIDMELEKKLYDSLSAVLEETGTRTAAAVAIDPRDGGILAMVSLPSFDNNLFARGISNEEYKNLIEDTNLPLFNRVVKGEYPPGSTFKMAVAAAGLAERVITPETTVNDSHGSISVGAWSFGDWKTHGLMNVRSAIAESCDVFFYAVGGGYGNISGLGMDRIKKYADLFGFGNPTGIDLPSEAAGLIPSEQWKLDQLGERWYIGDSYHSAIGQGFISVTPLQLAVYTAAIANRGTLFTPHLVSKIKNNEAEAIVKPEIVRSGFVSDDVLQVVREGMRQTVTSGTAQSLGTLPIEVAGKTGTAEYGVEKGHTHAWFVSFAPYDNPEIALVVLAEGAGEGHASAVPVSKEVLEWYFLREK